MTDTCRSCGAQLIWAKTVSAKPIPLDAEPVEGGNITLVDAWDGPLISTTQTAIVHGAGFATDLVPTYRSHYATCPQASEWRRRK